MSAEKKTRLGRGLEALLGEEPATNNGAGRGEVALAAIEVSPFQARKTFDEDDLSSLSDSIRNHGVLQPLVVRQVGDRFQLVAGERRLRAAQSAGLDKVPVTIVDFSDQQSYEAALVENVQRTDLNPIDKAHGFKDYLSRYQMTHEQLAARLGLGRATITNLVSLLDLPAEVQEAVRSGQLTTGHAKVLKGVNDPAHQVALAKEVISRGLSVHALDAMIKEQAGQKPEASSGGSSGGGSSGATLKTAHVQGIEDELKQRMGLKVEIKVKAKDRGQFVLSFESNDDFDRVVQALRK